MEQFYEALLQEAAFLQSLLDKTSRSLHRSPEGSLHVSQKGPDTFSYYQFVRKYKDKYPNGKYLPLKEIDKIRKLAQKDYDHAVYLYASDRLKELKYLISEYKENSLHDIYEKTKPGRRRLIVPYSYEPELIVPKWEIESQPSNPFLPENKTFQTNRGEYVRSKSEKIIADRYYMEGIPYRYEPELKLKNKTVYPDFKMLNIRTGKEFYHEHLGKMDDPDYSAASTYKIQEYIRNGIYPGENLLITTETSEHAFTGEILDLLISHYLI